jgi:hypothetical protein
MMSDTITPFDELLAAQTTLADAVEAVLAAQNALADATIALGEESGLLTV